MINLGFVWGLVRIEQEAKDERSENPEIRLRDMLSRLLPSFHDVYDDIIFRVVAVFDSHKISRSSQSMHIL